MPLKNADRCVGITARGTRCGNRRALGDYCRHHAPKPQKDDQLVRLAAGVRKVVSPEEEITRANTPEEMLRLSARQKALVASIGRHAWEAMRESERLALRCLLLERGNATRAAMRAGLSRAYFYSDGRSDAFRTANESVKVIVSELVEYDIIRRGYAGTSKIVRHKGMPVPITDPRVPVIKDPETGEPYMVRAPWDPETLIEFRGYEEDTEFSDTIGLHVLKAMQPDKWNKTPDQTIKVKTSTAEDLTARLAKELGVAQTTGDDLDQSYKLTD